MNGTQTLADRRRKTAERACAWAVDFEKERGYLPTFSDFYQKFREETTGFLADRINGWTDYDDPGDQTGPCTWKLQFRNGAQVRLRWDWTEVKTTKSVDDDTAETKRVLEPGDWEPVPESLGND